jgi:Tfp pilus assembly protein PilF
MFIATSISRLTNIRPSWEPNRRAGFSARNSAITSVTNGWQNSTPLDFVTTVCSRPPHFCGEDLLNPSADSERLVRCGPPQLRKTGQQAKAHAEEALRRDDSLAESHLALAEAVLLAEYDWERANGEFQRALAIDPAYSDARYNYAHMCLSPLGRYDQASRLLEEGLKKDPFSSKLHTELANIDLKRGRIDEAIERFRQNLARHPDAPGTLTNLAIAIQKQFHFAEALSYLARARRASPSDPWIAGHMAVCYIRLGRRAEAHTILEELTTRGGRTATPECSIASIYAALGNSSAAFEHLERAFALHLMQMLWLKVDPRFEPLRSDPRFAGLLASLRLR